MPAAIRIDLCSTAEVAPGNALKVDKAGLVLAVFNLDGEFFVTDDACTHGPGSLSEGFIEGEVVECNFHNDQFKSVQALLLSAISSWSLTANASAIFATSFSGYSPVSPVFPCLTLHFLPTAASPGLVVCEHLVGYNAA